MCSICSHGVVFRSLSVDDPQQLAPRPNDLIFIEWWHQAMVSSHAALQGLQFLSCVGGLVDLEKRKHRNTFV